MSKHLSWAIKPNNTPVAVLSKLANGTVVHISDATNGLVSSSILQAYIVFLILDILFKVILGMLWLSRVCPQLDLGQGSFIYSDRVIGTNFILL